jgi:hypothetical protein
VEGATGIYSFAMMQKAHDHYSQVRKPEIVMQAGVPRLKNASAFIGRGPHGAAIGLYSIFDTSELYMNGPFLHSVSETTANLEWWTSIPAIYELAWGETAEMTNVVKQLKAPACFTTFSLTGLKPGQACYFKIISADGSGRDSPGSVPVLKPETKPLVFKTLPDSSKPMVYYVAPDGNDATNGLSREQAWRTVSHAADTVNAGDTVMIAGGTYKEKVRIRSTGDEGRPITFRCMPGEKVIFNGENLDQAFKVVSKENIAFDGFYFEKYGGSIFFLWHGDQARITRCFNARGSGFIDAEYSRDVLVKNCVAGGGMGIASFHVCPGWRMENNLLLYPLISVLNFVNEPEQKGYFRKNIVTDNLPYKVKVALMSIGRFESFVEEKNWYFLRKPDDERKMFSFYGTAAYERYVPSYGVTTNYAKPPVFVDNPDGTENNPRLSLKDYQKMAGDTGSCVGDPKFAGTAGMQEGGTLWTGDPSTMFDKLTGKKDLDFPDTFATDPKAVEMGVGPQPDAFKDFWFNQKKENKDNQK